MPNPACTVNSATPPVDVSASSTVNGALANPTGAQYWALTCIGTDDSTSIAAINATLVVNQGPKTFSFTATSGAGAAYIFQSQVGINGLGLDANSQPVPAFTTTFKVNVKCVNGLRVVAENETTEQNSTVGWLQELNAAIRNAGGVGLSVGGSGPVHVTSGAIDANGYIGTAGQILFTNSAATDSTWASSSQDLTYSTSTIGQATVVGIRTHSVPAPSGTNTSLIWSGSSFSWGTTAVTVTWANDLSGNGTTTSTNQYVSSLSYSSAAAGGPIAINGTGTSLVIAANNTGFSLSQTIHASGAGVVLPISAQAAHTGSAGAGGLLQLSGGAGDGAGAPGPVVLRNGTATARSTRNITITAATYTFDSGAFPDGTVEFDTTSNAISATLPTPTNSREIVVIDSKGNWGANALTLVRHGSEQINDVAASLVLSAPGARVTITTDGTNWWAR